MYEKLSTSEVKKISKKLGWSLSETKKAIKEFKDAESIVNHDELLRICLNSENPLKRTSNVADLLCKSNYICEDIILKLLKHDILLFALRVFNISDMLFDENINVGFKVEMGGKRKTVIQDKNGVTKGSFLRFKDFITVEVKNSDMFYGYSNPNTLFVQYYRLDKIAYNLCDYYIVMDRTYYIKNNNIKAKIISPDRRGKQKLNEFLAEIFTHLRKNNTKEENMIINLFSQVEFQILNIAIIKDTICFKSQAKYLPDNREFIRKLKNTFIDINSNRNEITDKQYWFYYCLIEKIKEKGYKTKPASEIAEKLLNLAESGSIRNIYYIKNKQARNVENFDLDQFIIEQGFTNYINEYLEKVELHK